MKDVSSSSSTRKLAAPHVTVPLHEKPRLFQMGAGVHGISTRIDHFRLPGLWCVHFYRYRARLRLNDIWLDILPGSVGITPPDCDIEYRYEGRSEHLYAHFSLAPSTRNTSGHTFSDEVTIPLIQAADDEMLQSQWQETVGYAATRKSRAEVRLWEILWRLSERNISANQTKLHPLVERAQEIIELKLSEPICVADLARQLDVSHNHLTRLFNRYCQQNVVAYITARRIERARHLLIHSTLPIKAVAAQVGFHNLQDFNKMLRRNTGLAPRALRVQSSTRF